MRVFDTLIIGSGYSSVGYALANDNCLICEENEICDTHFYLPMMQYEYSEYLPRTEAGKELKVLYGQLGLWGEGMQNVNGFECGLCSFLERKDIKLLLKCRVIEICNAEENLKKITLITNSGLETVYAGKIVDTRSRGGYEGKYLTILFHTTDLQDAERRMLQAFPGAIIEKAFYNGRYALHVPSDGYEDVNQLKLSIRDTWKGQILNAKIMCMSAVPGVYRKLDGVCIDRESVIPCDDEFCNSVEAFEAGYLCGKEAVL